jgi:REP-associated tyrosine transposase
MATSCNHVYVHFVWATWDRVPLITPEREAAIYACVASKCREFRCKLVEIGGTEDPVHALVRLHSMISVAQMAKEMKGSSSHLVTHRVGSEQGFKWQGTYGAFSVTPGDIDAVRAYIQRQKEHHANSTILPDWERCMEAESTFA